MSLKHHSTYVFSLAKIKNQVVLRSAFQHNLRELTYELYQSKKIDAKKSRENYVLYGADESEALIKSFRHVIESANLPRKLRSDAVIGIEILFSLPVDHNISERDYFCDCIEWVRCAIGPHVISAVVHKDEASPHCHVILVPLENGKMRGSKLVGYKARLRTLHDDFYDRVAAKYGLQKPSVMSLLRKEAYVSMANQLCDLLLEHPALMMDHDVRRKMIDLLSQNPLEALEICQAKLLSCH